jgi:glycosylphosphatidylinositol transamidase (GPIT) subunit GPI8
LLSLQKKCLKIVPECAYYMRQYEYSIFVVSYQSISQIKLVSTPEKTLLFCKVINAFPFKGILFIGRVGAESRVTLIILCVYNAVVGSCCV